MERAPEQTQASIITEEKKEENGLFVARLACLQARVVALVINTESWVVGERR